MLDTDAEINDEKDGKRPDKMAPRYSGVQGYEWSEVAHEMLVIADGDIYRLTIDAGEWDAPIERPKAEESEALRRRGGAGGTEGAAGRRGRCGRGAGRWAG